MTFATCGLHLHQDEVPNVYDPSELRSDVNGKVVRYLHDEGTEIAKGDTFVVPWTDVTLTCFWDLLRFIDLLMFVLWNICG